MNGGVVTWEDDPEWNAGCCECDSLTFAQDFFRTYNVRVCKACKRGPGFALMSKATAKDRYLVTDRDLEGLGSMTRDNPNNASFQSMKLYLEKQVEEVALRKWGGFDGLQDERERKVQKKVDRGDKQFAKRQREKEEATGESMRAKRLRQKIEKEQAPHEHLYSEEVQDEENEDLWHKKCAVCGHRVSFEKF